MHRHSVSFLVEYCSLLVGQQAFVLLSFAFRDEIREECLFGISVHSVVSREFSILFFVPRCFLSCLLSLDVPFLVASTDLPYFVPFFSRLPSDRGDLPPSSAPDP